MDPPLDPATAGRFLEYALDLTRFLRSRRHGESSRDYYSLQPLIYEGRYWLDVVCRQELNRLQAWEAAKNLAVFALELRDWVPLFDLAQSFRKGDRIGYFGHLVGVLLPFTDSGVLSRIRGRIEREFQTSDLHTWRHGDGFDSYFDLQTQVKKLL